MPCRSRCVLLAPKRRYCWTRRDRSYASFTYPNFDLRTCRCWRLLTWAIPTAANFIIEYNWWKEVGQVSTWVSMLWYSIAPVAVGALVAFIALWWLMRGACTSPASASAIIRLYSRLVPVGLAIVAILFASASIDYWTVMRFFGSRGLTLRLQMLGRTRFFRTRCRFTCSICLSIQTCSGLCLCWRFFAPCCSGDGSWLAVVRTDRLAN